MSACPSCSGRVVWQLFDGSINECPHCTESGPDPDVCAACDHQRAFHHPAHDGICLGLDCECIQFAEPYPIGDVA